MVGSKSGNIVRARKTTQDGCFEVSLLPEGQEPRARPSAHGGRYQFNEEELPFWDAFESVAVSGHAGSLFLWDSRTVHAVRIPLTSRIPQVLILERPQISATAALGAHRIKPCNECLSWNPLDETQPCWTTSCEHVASPVMRAFRSPQREAESAPS